MGLSVQANYLHVEAWDDCTVVGDVVDTDRSGWRQERYGEFALRQCFDFDTVPPPVLLCLCPNTQAQVAVACLTKLASFSVLPIGIRRPRSSRDECRKDTSNCGMEGDLPPVCSIHDQR